MSKICFGIAVVFLAAHLAFADSQHATIQPPITEMGPEALALIDKSNASVVNPQQAEKLIALTSKQTTEFVIIHVLKWGDLDKNNNQTVQSNNWYVYRKTKPRQWSNEDFTSRNRIYGKRSIGFLYIHLNKQGKNDYVPLYDVKVEQKMSANLANLLSAASLFISATRAEKGGDEPKLISDFWGCGTLDDLYTPSNITITPKIPKVDSLEAKVFDNEGLAWWDVSFAVPIRRISQTTIDTTANTVTPTTVDKTNVFALIDFYLPPRDIKRTNFSYIPFPLAGVALAKQPLHKLLFGVGWGPAFANFYAGVLLVDQPSVKGIAAGSQATPSQVAAATHNGFSPQFTFGLNLPVKAIQSKLTKTK